MLAYVDNLVYFTLYNFTRNNLQITILVALNIKKRFMTKDVKNALVHEKCKT